MNHKSPRDLILFLIYVTDLSTTIQNGKIDQYADDSALPNRNKINNDLETGTLIKLNSCIYYFSGNYLHVNDSKTNYINCCLPQPGSGLRPST